MEKVYVLKKFYSAFNEEQSCDGTDILGFFTTKEKAKEALTASFNFLLNIIKNEEDFDNVEYGIDDHCAYITHTDTVSDETIYNYCIDVFDLDTLSNEETFLYQARDCTINRNE